MCKETAQADRPGLRVIGVVKLMSGVAALCAAVGLFGAAKHDPAQTAERIIEHFDLDPQNQLIHALMSALTGIEPKQLRAVAAGTFFYAALHVVEGTGLLMGFHWAEYLVVLATGSLVPFEIYEISRKTTALRVGLLIVNLAIVGYLIYALRADRKRRNAVKREGVSQAGTVD